MAINSYDQLCIDLGATFHVNYNTPLPSSPTLYQMEVVNDDLTEFQRQVSLWDAPTGAKWLSNTGYPHPNFVNHGINQTTGDYGNWANDSTLMARVRAGWSSNIVTAFTMSAWFRPTSLLTSSQWLFRFSPNGMGILWNQHASFPTTTGQIQGMFYDRFSNYWNRIGSFPSILNQWHQAVWVVDTTSNLSIWADGSRRSQYTLPSESLNTNQFNIAQIGFENTIGQMHRGNMGPCTLWPRVLTDDEIFALWDEGLGIAEMVDVAPLRPLALRARTDHVLINSAPANPPALNLEIEVQDLFVWEEDGDPYVGEGQFLEVGDELVFHGFGTVSTDDGTHIHEARIVTEVDGQYSFDFETPALGWLNPATESKNFQSGFAADTTDWVVPAFVNLLTVYCSGNGSWNYPADNQPNPYGGTSRCDLAVTPGETLRFTLGGKAVGPTGGFNGGGNSTTGTGGHGASDVRRPPYGLADRLIIGSGGGGAGANPTPQQGQPGQGGHGASGTANGSSGYAATDGTNAGAGATTTAGGAGGANGNPGSAGALGQGGAGGANGGGGGGGGLYGGGGGSGSAGGLGGGGGGGSSLGTGVNQSFGFGTTGQISITYSLPADPAHPFRTTVYDDYMVVQLADKWFAHGYNNATGNNVFYPYRIVSEDPLVIDTEDPVTPYTASTNTNSRYTGSSATRVAIGLDATNMAVLRLGAVNTGPTLHMTSWSGLTPTNRSSITLGGVVPFGDFDHIGSQSFLYLEKISATELLVLWRKSIDTPLYGQVVTFNLTTGTFTAQGTPTYMQSRIRDVNECIWYDEQRMLLLIGFDDDYSGIFGQTLRVNGTTVEDLNSGSLVVAGDEGWFNYSAAVVGDHGHYAVVYSQPDGPASDDALVNILYKKFTIAMSPRDFGAFAVYESGLIEAGVDVTDDEMWTLSRRHKRPNGDSIVMFERYRADYDIVEYKMLVGRFT